MYLTKFDHLAIQISSALNSAYSDNINYCVSKKVFADFFIKIKHVFFKQ